MGAQIDVTAVFWVGIGGFIGANARFFLINWAANWAPSWLNGSFLHPTIIVNCIGSFVLAAFLSWASERANVREPFRQFFAIGFLGAFTTFSSFTMDLLNLNFERGWWSTLSSAVVHNGICLTAAFLGWRLALTK